MQFDITWLLMSIPIAFALGWLASRWDLKQWRLRPQQAPKAYFKGLNYLLHEQHDLAIDAFIQAAQHDPDTSELHFALGNLFRQRGDYDRAIRVHEHLLERADLSQADHSRAMHALASDFLKAGLLDRAEATLKRLFGTSYEFQSKMSLLSLYERSSDWIQAFEMAQQLEQGQMGSFRSQMSHYLCERAQPLMQQKQWDEALALLHKAISLCADAIRAHLDHAFVLYQMGKQPAALQSLIQFVYHVPKALPLCAQTLVAWAIELHRTADVIPIFQAAMQQAPSVDAIRAWTLIQDSQQTKGQLALQYLEQEPSLLMAHMWLEQAAPGLPAPVLKAIDLAVKPLNRYRCASCGFESTRHFWQCPGCQSWDSYSLKRVEEL
jgi:lipopolysaccharide biosynthesis regulator YciM